MSEIVERLDYDPVTKIETVFAGETDGSHTIATLQDVTDIVEANKTLYNDVDERARYGERMQRVAQIPLGIFYDLKRRGIVDDAVAFRKWLDDRDNLAFRTRPGRLSR